MGSCMPSISSLLLQQMTEQQKRKRDGSDNQHAAKQSKPDPFNVFMQWIDERCLACWNARFQAKEWSHCFKAVYNTDDALRSILKIWRKNGLDVIGCQLKGKVGDGIGMVVDEIVAQLDELYPESVPAGITRFITITDPVGAPACFQGHPV